MNRLLSLRFSLLLLCSLAVFASGALQAQNTTIVGKILGFNSKPMPAAHIHLQELTATNDKTISQAAGKDGSYSVTVPNGWYRLTFSGVNHMADNVPPAIYCSGPEIHLNVRLQANAIPVAPDSVQIITELDHYSFVKAQTMTKMPDGRYSFEVKGAGATLGYQVIVYTKGNSDAHSINGTQADDYEYDGGGDYRCKVNTNNGAVTVVFDPKQLPTDSKESDEQFVDAASKAMSEVVFDQMSLQTEYYNAMTHQQEGQKVDYDATSHRKKFAKLFKAERSPILKQLLMMSYLRVQSLPGDNSKPSPAIVDEILQSIAPSSGMWEYYSDLLGFAVQSSSNPNSDYEDRVLKENPNTTVKAQILCDRLEKALKNKDMDNAKRLYATLTTDYKDTWPGHRAKTELNPGSTVKLGARIPDFAFEAMEDSTKKYTAKEFRGKWVLIDNWATWCGPCVGEMASLHAAWDHFKSKNFVILSVSFDRTKQDVAKFRGAKWSMPWTHCFSAGVWKNEATKIFEISGIPKPILVDPTGTIVAMDADLRGGALEQTLKKYLAD